MDKLLTKEEIWNKENLKDCSWTDSAMVAMDIYSRQMAIGFYNWIEKENTIWRNEKEEPLTDDELYELYISQSVNK